MGRRQRRIVLIVAIPGILVCLGGLAGFVLEIVRNDLPIRALDSVRDYYLVVGRAFSRGFVTGFFLCFFLMLVAIAVGTWVDQRRQRRLRAGSIAASPRVRPV